MAAILLVQGGAALAVDYDREVKPLLKEKCSFCHGPLNQEAGLRLDAASLILQGGESGSAVNLTKPAESLILRRITAEDEFERMPPEGEGEPLSDREVETLRDWIAAGAPLPEDEEFLSGPEDHWAYRPVRRPELPDVEDADWSAHPVDRLVAHLHQERGIQAFETADQRTLLRRVALDLIGLPLPPEELDAFLEDSSPDAYERVVDRLLASPHYGERWGRHWMDIWRYSDWNGYKQEVRGSQRHIWRWRDWIIESLNEDKGYDQMIREMLAADEVASGDPETLRATGYLARNYHNRNRDMWLDATVEHTAKAFLGITLECARCHDHKYDPIPQVDYYRFRAFFEPHDVRTDRIPGVRDVMQDGLPRVYDAWPERETLVYEAGDERRPRKDEPVSPGIPAVFGGELPIEPVSLPLEGWTTELRDFIEREEVTALEAQFRKSREELDRIRETEAEEAGLRRAELKFTAAHLELGSLQARWRADRAKHLGIPGGADQEQLTEEASRLEREFNVAAAELALFDKQRALEKVRTNDEQDREKKLQEAGKGLDQANETLESARAALDEKDPSYTPVGRTYPQTSTGRRAVLAEWIASGENPLTARVAVNHVWMRHFVRPLVSSVVDFGLSTPRPVHADLLDWLAAELISSGRSGSGWSLKHLHRLIVTSRVYRLSSSSAGASAAGAAADPENALFWKRTPRRLEAEVVRDSLLAAAETLDRRVGGADIDFTEGESVPRRSIYFRTAYEKQMQFLTLFDAASPSECYRRGESVIPQQALAIANSPLARTQSRKLARLLWSDVSESGNPDDAFVESVFVRVLSRLPQSEERRLCLEFLREQTKRLSEPETLTALEKGPEPQLPPAEDPALRARENLVHAIFNHNDFVTVR